MDELLYEVRDGVGYVTFNRPQARNALTFAMYERLAEICNEAAEKRAVRAILMSGAGDKAFAAGTDISQYRTFDKEEDALQYEERIDRVMNAIEACPVPTIAAIHGACTGGGASIAACCDLRLASRAIKYGFPVARTLGNCLSLASYNRLVYLVGPALVKACRPHSPTPFARTDDAPTFYFSFSIFYFPHAVAFAEAIQQGN